MPHHEDDDLAPDAWKKPKAETQRTMLLPSARFANAAELARRLTVLHRQQMTLCAALAKALDDNASTCRTDGTDDAYEATHPTRDG